MCTYTVMKRISLPKCRRWEPKVFNFAFLYVSLYISNINVFRTNASSNFERGKSAMWKPLNVVSVRAVVFSVRSYYFEH